MAKVFFFFFFNIKETHHVFIGQEFLFSSSGEIFVRSQKIEKVTLQPRTLKLCNCLPDVFPFVWIKISIYIEAKKSRNLSLFVKRISVTVLIRNEQCHLAHAVTTVWKNGGQVCDYGHCHLQGLLRKQLPLMKLHIKPVKEPPHCSYMH